MIVAIIMTILFLSLSVVGYLLVEIRRQSSLPLSFGEQTRLMGSGILAFIADTLGVGSFAVNIALAKLFGTFEDEELPAMCNIVQLIPGVIESLFFIKSVEVDLKTMLVLVLGTCIGGLLGGQLVSRMSKQTVRLAMIVCFSLIILLILANQYHILPIGGDATALYSWKLAIGFVALIVCGALTSLGIGLFAMVQAVLFLLSLSPLVAFPIMMVAGAMQQPLTVFMFLRQSKGLPLKRMLMVSIGGCLGVLLTLPVFHYFSTRWLHTLLILILSFNLLSMSRAFIRARADKLNVVAEA